MSKRATGALATLGLLLAACTSGDPIGTTGSTTGSGGQGAVTSTTSGTGGAGGGTSSAGGAGTGGSIFGTGGAPPDDPCTGAMDGPHCGAALGGLADHGSLYQCTSGSTASVQACAAGCSNDACTAPPSDPCESAQFGNGDYCGGSLQGGDSTKLYTCQNGSTSSSKTCSAGCQVQPPGVADTCKPQGDPCQAASSGNGLYCGGSIGGDPNKLYDCQSQATASATACTNGCQIMPPGTPDQCAATTNDCCLNEPPGALTQAYSACGQGGVHYGRDYGTAVGTPIYAGMAGTVVGSALGYPNCYSNGCSSSCWNAFNYVKVKADCGDPDVAGHDLFIYYLHIDDLAGGVSNGTHVSQGQLLAYSGNSGCSSGPHIHIETVSVPTGSSASLSTCNSVDPATRYCP